MTSGCAPRPPAISNVRSFHRLVVEIGCPFGATTVINGGVLSEWRQSGDAALARGMGVGAWKTLRGEPRGVKLLERQQQASLVTISWCVRRGSHFTDREIRLRVVYPRAGREGRDRRDGLLSPQQSVFGWKCITVNARRNPLGQSARRWYVEWRYSGQCS